MVAFIIEYLTGSEKNIITQPSTCDRFVGSFGVRGKCGKQLRQLHLFLERQWKAVALYN